MKKLSALIPAFWQQFDHHLLTHYPKLWRTRIHQVLASCMFLGTVLFLVGYARSYDLKSVVCLEYYLGSLHHSVVFPILIFVTLGLIYWRLKLREFSILVVNIRQAALLLVTTFLGLTAVYYAGSAYFLGYNLRVFNDMEQVLEPDINFLQEKNYLQLKGLVAYRDDDQLVAANEHFKRAENLIVKLKDKPHRNAAFNTWDDGLRMDYHNTINRENFPPLDSYGGNYGARLPYQWPADSAVYYLDSYYQQIEQQRSKMALKEELGTEMEKPHGSTADREIRHEQSIRAHATLARLSYDELQPIIERYGELLELQNYTQEMYTGWLHVQLEWYSLLHSFFVSLDAEEVDLYKQHRQTIAESWLMDTNLANSLLLMEMMVFCQTHRTSQDYDFLDEDSRNKYKIACFYYRNEMPEGIDEINYGAVEEMTSLAQMVGEYFAQSPILTQADSLYFFEPLQSQLSSEVQFRLTAFTFYQIWLKNLYVYYQSQFSTADKARFSQVVENLGLDYSMKVSYNYGGIREHWLSYSEQNDRYDSHKNLQYESGFLLPLLVIQSEDRLDKLQQNLRNILTLQIDMYAPWQGLLLLALGSMFFFFLSVFNLRVLLISSLAVSLAFLGMVTLNELPYDSYFRESTLAVHLFLLAWVFYLFRGLSYQTLRGQIWLCSTVFFTTMVPLLLSMRSYSNDIFTESELISLLMAYTLVVYLVLFALYFQQKHLPLKK